ncbi:MAG: restriction endonuclease subunit S, partial [Paludibacteraceae bacterium]|nr:restriction endonuclease subunit S [Paludibacteraceae bacterium]
MPPCEGGYKEFKIGKLFETPQNSQKIDKLALSNNGSIPVFSSNSTNNGIIGYCDLEPHWKVDEQKPIYLLFGDHTRTFHIAKTDFCITDNVKVLLPKYSAINERVLLYIIASWKKCIPNLGYARHWSQAKLVKILLPTTSTGEIDFQFIESRMRELEEERMRELEAYLTA